MCASSYLYVGLYFGCFGGVETVTWICSKMMTIIIPERRMRKLIAIYRSLPYLFCDFISFLTCDGHMISSPNDFFIRWAFSRRKMRAKPSFGAGVGQVAAVTAARAHGTIEGI